MSGCVVLSADAAAVDISVVDAACPGVVVVVPASYCRYHYLLTAWKLET